MPDLTLKNEKGEDVQVAELAAEKGVVFFLVPKADTRRSFWRSLLGLVSEFIPCSGMHAAGLWFQGRLPRLLVA